MAQLRTTVEREPGGAIRFRPRVENGWTTRTLLLAGGVGVLLMVLVVGDAHRSAGDKWRLVVPIAVSTALPLLGGLYLLSRCTSVRLGTDAVTVERGCLFWSRCRSYSLDDFAGLRLSRALLPAAVEPARAAFALGLGGAVPGAASLPAPASVSVYGLSLAHRSDPRLDIPLFASLEPAQITAVAKAIAAIHPLPLSD